ncbi:MAG: NAD-dependent epimerase/dehydratase family protein [Candidatus Thermoplasmatota archaeon]|nr:NAD-dependent epimerase/dehydratase family protein [Candidatus Thermoplasmatota archaeon]
MKGKRILITGIAGFIGSNMAEYFLDENEIIGVDNLSSGRMENLRDLEGNKNFILHINDVKNNDELSKLMKGVDVVIHLSANPDVRVGYDDPIVDFRENTVATHSVLEAMRKNDVKEIIFSSSSTIYGIPTILPTPENYGPLKPVSHYGASKLAAEGFISSYSSMYGFTSSIFRFANVVGKRGTHGVIVDFINKLKKDGKVLEVLGDGTQSKSYVDVQDVISGIDLLHGKGDGIFNLGTAGRTTVMEIADLVIKKESPGARIKLMGGPGGGGWAGDVKVMSLDIKKAQSFGWKYRMESTDSVRNAIEELGDKR